MDVFISWSGERSKAIAQALHQWLPLVLQPVKPWISSEIEKGSRWDDVIAERLEQSNFGILCLTPENLTSDWMLFEAGALSKKARHSRVCTFLYDLRESDISGPLARFQHTRADKEDAGRLLDTLNRALEASALDGDRLRQTYEHWWPELERRLASVAPIKTPVAEKRTVDDKVDELLVEVRALRRSVYAPRGTVYRASDTLDDEGDDSPHVVSAPVDFIPTKLSLARVTCLYHQLPPVIEKDSSGAIQIHACCHPFLAEVIKLIRHERDFSRGAESAANQSTA